MRSHLQARGLISDADLSLYSVTDDPEVAGPEITRFYSNYHSSRYVRGTFVIRVRHAPGAAALEALNRDFADIVASGRIEVAEALEAENGEVPDLPRITLDFDRRSVGRLRERIDEINDLAVAGEPEAPASPPEIVSYALSEEAERAEQEES